MIILDFGSGNTCQNDEKIIHKMIQSLAEIDTRYHEVIIKWQLFEKAGDNIPLERLSFIKAYDYAKQSGYQTTASVFDEGSLNFLMRFDIPFVKIANKAELYYLADMVENDLRVIRSVPSPELFGENCMACVSKYPATMKEYEKIFTEKELKVGISDHTTDWKLYKKYEPEIYECHFCLDNSEGLDAGPFARRSNQLREIL